MISFDRSALIRILPVCLPRFVGLTLRTHAYTKIIFFVSSKGMLFRDQCQFSAREKYNESRASIFLNIIIGYIYICIPGLCEIHQH